MPATDHVESSSQVPAPSQAVPQVAVPQVYPHNFPLPHAMKCHGDVVGNWDFFKQQWSDYEIATGLDKREESVRLATLRSAMGRECLQIFLNLNLTEEDKKKVDKCLEALENYFKPGRNVVYERYVFNTCVQQNEESVQSYVTRLRKLAASCEYGELTDEFIRDRLVIGLKDKGDKVRLLREKKLDLQKAIQMCTTSEVVSRQMKNIQGAEDKQTEEVRKFNDRKKKQKNPHRKKEEEKSSKAKKNEDEKTKRESSETKCRYCERVHQVEDSNESSSDESCLRVETVSLVQTKSRQWFADITFFNSAEEEFSTTLACQLDTGATCNVLCLDDLSAITQLGDPPMKNSTVKLKLFGGSTMKPAGECDLHIKHNGTKHVLKFQVIQDKCKPLLSAETCEKLQLIQLNASVTDSVHQLNDSVVPEPLSKEELMSKFHDVFNGLGHIGDAKIVVDQSVAPVQHSPRRVPVALRKDVEKKILELEEKGIITKAVEPSQWISSMVVVAKPQKIRICLDPKDLNRAIQRPKFQMPTLEELLPELSKARIESSVHSMQRMDFIKSVSMKTVVN
ncbi:hypothetical protein ACROYT_G040629 [Oculina patagonica]